MILFNRITFASANPSVFTDAYCYLDWIAKQYGKSVQPSYEKPITCKTSKGDIADIEKKRCKASRQRYPDYSQQSNLTTVCHFGQIDEHGKPFDKCRLVAEEGFAYNLYQCKDPWGANVTCANNCRGVDPNAVVIGGTAVLAATATVPIGLQLISALGLGGIGLAGAGTVANGMCPIGSCPVRHIFNK